MLKPVEDQQQSYTTDTVPMERRFPYWSNLISRHLSPLVVPDPDGSVDRCWGRLCLQQIGGVRVLEIESSVAAIQLDEPRAEMHDLLIIQQVKGEAILIRGEEQTTLFPGDLAVVDYRQSFRLVADVAVSYAVLQMTPDSKVADFAGLTHSGCIRVDGSQGSGAVASDFVRSYREQADGLSQEVADSLLRALISVLDTAALEAAGKEVRRSRQRSFHVRRIKRFITDNLRDPALKPAMIADATGLSRRYLDELFRNESSSIARYVWGRRLESCHRDLQDSRLENRHITEIAFAWGFNSASHFSRSFGERFSMSPTQARALATTNREIRSRSQIAAG